MESLLSRKFVYAILIVILSYSLVLMDKFDAQRWMDGVIALGGIYIIGNVAARITDTVGGIKND
jgi:hypothetical protein